MDIRIAFNMDADPIGTGVNEGLDVILRFFNHKMDIKWERCNSPAGFNDEWTHGNVGYKMAIHHINVNPVNAGVLRLVYLIREVSKIC